MRDLPWPPPGRNDIFPTDQLAGEFLEKAEIGDAWVLPRVSNMTLLVELGHDQKEAYGVYKPRIGERPLWDFANGSLYRRERAAYLLSDFLGWNIVPPTVIRDGPYGIGSLQLYVPPVEESNYFSLPVGYDFQLSRIVLFDMLANNTDRKGSHCFEAASGGIWGVDHGLTFNAIPKLRSVIWDFANTSIPKEILRPVEELRDELENLKSLLRESLSELLSSEENLALRIRAAEILEAPIFPFPKSRHDFPWPAV